MLLQAKEEKMAKLTDTQLIVLSKAAARDDGAGVIPAKMTKAAASKVGSSLIARKLMREIRSKQGMPIWRAAADGRNISLIITRAGRDAIGVDEDDDAVSDSEVSPKANAARPADAKPRPSAASLRAGSKQALVVSMLSKDKGASLDALI